ncbi:MAG: hypothetical protein ACYSUI_15410 [Planctomycetota bacterium]|jgi:hypothetical protein
MAEVNQTNIKKISAAKSMRKLMADHFHELDRALGEGPPKVAGVRALGWRSYCWTGAGPGSPGLSHPVSTGIVFRFLVT